MNYTCSLICDGKKAIMKRKIIALLLTLTMLVSMAPAAFAADAEFTDVPKDTWYSQAVAWAVENGITGGIGNGMFGPDNTCTRAQVVTFLWAAADKPVLAAENPFKDVKSEDWYYNAVMWAVENGITGGTSATTFSPDDPCTRAQVVTFLYAASGKPEIAADAGGFGDVTKNDWFYAPVMWAVANSITGGIGNGLFGPNNSCTRAQIALFLYKEDMVEPEPTPPAEDVTVSMIAAEYGSRSAEWWKSFEADFEAEYEHIDLVVDVLSWDKIYTEIETRLSKNEAPDLLNIDIFSDYQADGLLLPADEWLSSETYAKFYPAFLNESVVDGKVWAVPDLASARAMYFNADILAASGVEVPTTWAELTEVCEAIKAYDDSIIPWGIDMTTDEGQAAFAYYAWTNGGGFVDAEGNWTLNSAENAEAVDFAVALVKEGLTNADPANETRYDLQTMFAEGKLAMMIAPDQLSLMIADINPDMNFGIAPLPVNKEGANASIGVMDRIMCFDNDYSEAELAAVKAVMDFFYEDTRYAEWCKMEGFLPATTGGAKAMMEIDDTAMDWDEILASAQFYPAYKPEWWNVKQGVISVLQQTLQGGDAQKLLDALQREITGEPEPTPPDDSDDETEGQSLCVSLASEPATLDPALNSAVDGATMISHLFSGLAKWESDANGNLSIVADGAEELVKGVKNSDGTITYTYTLRDMKWSDGQPVTAEDYEFAWKRGAAEDTWADYGYMFEVIEGYPNNLAVKALDSRTLEVKLSSDVTYWNELLALPIYMPVRADVVANTNWACDPATYVSNGLYTMTEWKHDEYIVLSKNMAHPDAAKVTMPELRFRLSNDANATLKEYEAGNCLMIDDIPIENGLAELSKYGNEFRVVGELGTYYANWNVNRNLLPASSVLTGVAAEKANAEIRNALNAIVDRVYICEEIGRTGQVPASSFVAMGMTDVSGGQFYENAGHDEDHVGYYDVSAEGYEAEYNNAIETLKKYYTFDEATGKFADVPTVEYIYNESAGHRAIGEYLCYEFSSIGIPVVLKEQEWDIFLNTRKNGDYALARNGWLADYNDPIYFLDMWTSDSGNNDAQFGMNAHGDLAMYDLDLTPYGLNTKVENGTWAETYDVLIGAIKECESRTDRYAMMHLAEDMLMETGCIMPLYYYTDIFLLDSSVNGFYCTPLGYKCFAYTTIEK